jgi:hypothetical protein
MSTYDDRDETDWPEDDVGQSHKPSADETPPREEPEDDASKLPIRNTPRRSSQRRRGTYRPPSELDD